MSSENKKLIIYGFFSVIAGLNASIVIQLYPGTAAVIALAFIFVASMTILLSTKGFRSWANHFRSQIVLLSLWMGFLIGSWNDLDVGANAFIVLWPFCAVTAIVLMIILSCCHKVSQLMGKLGLRGFIDSECDFNRDVVQNWIPPFLSQANTTV